MDPGIEHPRSVEIEIKIKDKICTITSHNIKLQNIINGWFVGFIKNLQVGGWHWRSLIGIILVSDYPSCQIHANRAVFFTYFKNIGMHSTSLRMSSTLLGKWPLRAITCKHIPSLPVVHLALEREMEWRFRFTTARARL